jgi:hypothetical protein
MDVDGEMNQTIQHHPPAQAPVSSNTQQPQQPFMPGLPQPTAGKPLCLPFPILLTTFQK